jgi:hypothetical protein
MFTDACLRLLTPVTRQLAQLPSQIGEASVEAVYTWRKGWLTTILKSHNGSWWRVTCAADAAGGRIAVLSIVDAWGRFSPQWRLQDFLPSPSGTYIAYVLACGSVESPDDRRWLGLAIGSPRCVR